MLLSVSLMLLNKSHQEMWDFTRSRLDCGIGFGQLVQERDVSWIRREKKVMERESGKGTRKERTFGELGST